MAGETVSTSSKFAPYEAFVGLFLVPFSLSFATGNLELNDVMEVGYLPANCTVYGLIFQPTDMDSNGAPALAQKVTIGSTDVATGLTGGQSGTGSFVPIAPVTLTAQTLAKITNTAAAATAVAGTVNIAFLCQK